MKKINNYVILSIYLFISIITIAHFVDFNGVFGGHDWPSTFLTPEMQEIFINHYAWDDVFIGHPTGKTIIFPYLFFFGPLSLVMGYTNIIKLFLLLTLSFGGFGMYIFLNSFFKLNKFSSFLGGLFYLGSPFMFNNICAGFLFFVWGMALTPFALLFFLEGISSKTINWKKISMGTFFLCITTQIQVSVVLFFIFFCFLFINCYQQKSFIFTKFFKVSSFIILIFLVINSFWIYSILADINGEKQGEESLFSKIDQKYSHDYWMMSYSKKTNLFKSIRLISSNNDEYFLGTVSDNKLPIWARIYWSDPFKKIPLRKEIIPFEIWQISSFFIILASFLLLFLTKKKSKHLFLIFTLYLSGIFLSKAITSPFIIFSHLIFNNPLVSTLYRDPSHFVFIPALTLPILFAHSVDFLSQLRKKILNILLIIILIIYIYPIFLGDFGGNIYTFNLSNEQIEFYNKYDFSNNRTLWIPFSGDLFIQNNTYRYTRDPILPTVTGYKTFYTKFLMKIFSYPSFTHKGNFLKYYNVDNILLRKDYSSINSEFVGYSKLWQQSLENDRDLEKIEEGNLINVYKNKELLPKIYSPEVVFLTDGDMRDILYSYYLPINITSSTYIFSKNNNNLDLFDNLLIHHDINSMVLDTTNNKLEIIPSKYANDAFAFRSWVPIQSEYWWGIYDLFPASSISDGIFTISNSDLNLSLLIKETNNYDIWVNLMKWEKGGKIGLSFDNRIFSVDTLSNSRTINWEKLGEIHLQKGNHEINIHNLDGESALYKIALINKGDLDDELVELKELLKNKNLLFYKHQEEIKGSIQEEYLRVMNFDKAYWYYQGGTSMSGKPINFDEIKGEKAVIIQKNNNIPWVRVRANVDNQDWLGFDFISVRVYFNNSEEVKWFKIKLNGDDGFQYTDAGPFKRGWNEILIKPNYKLNIGWDKINSIYAEIEYNNNVAISSNSFLEGIYLTRFKSKKTDISYLDISKIFDYTSSYDKFISQYKNIKTKNDFNKVFNLVDSNSEIKINSSSLLAYDYYNSIKVPLVDFKKLSPSLYKVAITNSTEPFFLTFSEEYNDKWNIYLEKLGFLDFIFPNIEDESTHFKSNGFTNTWHINKTGSYNLYIYYIRDGKYRLLLLISLIFIVSIILLYFKK